MGLLSRTKPEGPPRTSMFLGDDPRGPSKEIEFTWSGAPLDDESIRALATGLQFSFAWRADNDQLPMLPGTRDPAAQIGDWIEMLHEWWGATDGDSIRTTVRNLQSGMHSQFYEVVHPLVVEALADDAHPTHRDSLQSRHLRFLADVEAFHGRQPGFFTDDYRAWIQVLRAGGAACIGGELPPHVMSWDLMRAAMLARGGATVGYIDHEEAWDMLAHNLELARCYYANWGQCARGYVVGHLYWSSQTDVSSAIDDTARRATSMARCLDTALSLWRRVALHPGEPFHGVDAWTSFEPTRR
ncbi:DUF1266 domain-containing protein [Corynebacterium xerosis]|uniref:DUF1266 domain-containing protein n=1 Tax=Corynebacterium xerosis TaxID=1725 RepID=UPI000EB3B3BF|nr:DUF1266 domain-containing protein [Corynebacterium xerosis]AYJ32030.1 DUF1266 domain-containing protein [Corynebacterium xerosis]